VDDEAARIRRLNVRGEKSELLRTISAEGYLEIGSKLKGLPKRKTGIKEDETGHGTRVD
jgi:hypothetical protein